MTQEEMLVSTGLNWKVESEGLQTLPSGIIVPDRVALIREDTRKVLGIHAKSYVPYQNNELLELLFKISQQSGLRVHSGGCFKGGQRVWFQLKSNDLNIGTDRVEGFISGMNSFDGSSSLAFGNSKTTISCGNTWWTVYREVDTRLRHSSTMIPRIEEILRKIDILLEEEQEGFAEIQRLGNTTMTSDMKELVTRMLFNLDKEEQLDGDELSTRMQNNILRFELDVDTEVQGKGSNLWGLFSGVTRYTTHSMKKDKDNSEAKMFGHTGVVERKIYNELVGMTV